MDSDTIWRHIDEQRVSLAALLEGIEAERWATPSLCEGWAVREVAAYVTHSQMSLWKGIVALVSSGFRFNAMIYRMALRDKRTPAELTAALRGMPGSRKHPPGTSELDPLTDVLVARPGHRGAARH